MSNRAMGKPPPPNWRELIEACTSETEVRALVGTNHDWNGPVGIRALEKIESMHRAAMRPTAWYKQPATWIAISSLIVSLLVWLFPRH
jgi:hypothetical protein